jgi:hypothetical protein
VGYFLGKDSLPPNSLTLYSTYELKNDDAGILVEDTERSKN